MDAARAVIGGAFDERPPTYDESTMYRRVAEFVDREGIDVVLDVAKSPLP